MATTIYVWSKVDLPDPPAYFYGFKEARIMSWGEINRSLSDDRGQYEGADFSFVAADVDRLIRGLMAGNATKYGFVNRNVTMRMISDEARRQLLTPRVIARGLVTEAIPLSPMHVQFRCVDFVSSKFAGTNTNKQIPQRSVGLDFAGSPLEVRPKGVPIIYGTVSDEASASSPPVITGDAARGAFVDGGFWAAGFGDNVSSAAVPTGVTPSVVAGGALSLDVPHAQYGVVVTAIDALGRESSSSPFYTDAAGAGSFAGTPVTGLTVSLGNQQVNVSWAASAGAVAYRCYLGWYYFGYRPVQYIQTAGLSCSFTDGADWASAATDANITPAADLVTFGQFWWYVVMARMGDGLTGVSATVFGITRGVVRPIRIQWEAVPGALEYVIARRGTGDFDRQWSVSSAFLFFDDDLIDTGVTYLDGGLEQPRGAVPLHYIGDYVDDSGSAAGTWAAFLVSGHACLKVTPFLNGNRVDPGSYGVTWLVPGQTSAIPYTTYFASSGTLGRYRDINTRRYCILYVRGPDAEAAKSGQVSANVEGIEASGDGSGAVITSILDQYKHFVINFGFQDYQSGAWLTAPTWAPDAPTVSQVDETSFDDAKAIAATRITGGYLGGGIIGNKGEFSTLREWMARWNLSANVDSGFNRNMQFFVVMMNDNFSATAGALVFTQLQDIIADTLQITPQRDKHFNVCPYNFRYNWREGKWAVEDEDVSDQTSIDGYLEELIAPTTDLWFVRDATTAADVMQRRLLLSKDPPRLVAFKTPLVGFNTDLGDFIKVTHTDGIGASGWNQAVMRIQRQSLNPNDFTIRMECLDVDFIFTGAFILGDDTWAVDWLTADTTERQYGFLCDETTGEFSNGDPGKRLR